MNKKSTTVPLHRESPGCTLFIAKTIAVAMVAVLLGWAIARSMTPEHKIGKKTTLSNKTINSKKQKLTCIKQLHGRR